MSASYDRKLKKMIGREFSSKGLTLSGSAGKDILSVLRFSFFSFLSFCLVFMYMKIMNLL